MRGNKAGSSKGGGEYKEEEEERVEAAAQTPMNPRCQGDSASLPSSLSR